MEIIDLINKIINKEKVPRKIRYKNKIFVFESNIYWLYGSDNLELTDYLDCDFSNWNDEIEIIEEDKKIKHCNNYNQFDDVDDFADHLKDKINELINEVNKLKEN